MINTATERLLTLQEAIPFAPRRSRNVSTRQIWRWCTRGTSVGNGRRVKLDSIKMDGLLYTTEESFRRWETALQQAREEASTQGATDTAAVAPVAARPSRPARAQRSMDEWNSRRGRTAPVAVGATR